MDYGHSIINDVIAGILNRNQFSITQVDHVKVIRSFILTDETQKRVEQLISEKDIASVKNLSDEITGEQGTAGFREYLYVILFDNQIHDKFAATVYDSDALEQYPEILNIYPL